MHHGRDRAPHEGYRVELFVFPDGTSVELMVFDRPDAGGTRRARRRTPQPEGSASRPARQTAPEAAGQAAAASAPGGAPPSPEPERRAPDAGLSVIVSGAEARVCPVCGGGLVYPVDWERRSAGTWALRLRCPECETVRGVLMDRAGVEQLNRELYQARREVADASRELSRRHFAEEVERIVAALRSGLIQPMDF